MYDVVSLERRLVAVKECRTCHMVLTLESFSRNARSADGRGRVCKECSKEYKLLRRYNMTLEQKEQLFIKQQGRCGICSKELSFDGYDTHIDHCHATGKIRGILCRDCNTALGKLGDTPETLLRAYRYVSGQGQ